MIHIISKIEPSTNENAPMGLIIRVNPNLINTKWCDLYSLVLMISTILEAELVYPIFRPRIIHWHACTCSQTSAGHTHNVRNIRYTKTSCFCHTRMHKRGPRPLPTLSVQPTPVQMPNMRVTRRDFCDCQSTLCPGSTPCSSRPSNCPYSNALSHTPNGCKCVPAAVDWVPDAPASCHTQLKPAAVACWLPVCLSATLRVSGVVQHNSCASLRCTYPSATVAIGYPTIKSDH